MLPTPATTCWSRSSALIGAVRPLNRPARLRLEGRAVWASGPSRARDDASSSSGVHTTMNPNVRGSTEAHLAAAGELDDDLGVRRLLVAGVGELHAPGHPQVGDPCEVAVEVGEEELAVTAQGQHGPAGEPVGEIGRPHLAADGAVTADGNGGHPSSDEVRLQPASGGLDLGEFRHPRGRACGPRRGRHLAPPSSSTSPPRCRAPGCRR